MATLSCRSLLLKEKILRKYEEKKRQRKSLDVGLQKESPDEVIRTNKHRGYISFGIVLLVICKEAVDTVRASREPLKVILRFIRVVACVVTCFIALNYLYPSWKITISGISDFPSIQRLSYTEIFQLTSIFTIIAWPSPKSTERDEIINQKGEIKNEKDEIKNQKGEIKNEKDAIKKGRNDIKNEKDEIKKKDAEL